MYILEAWLKDYSRRWSAHFVNIFDMPYHHDYYQYVSEINCCSSDDRYVGSSNISDYEIGMWDTDGGEYMNCNWNEISWGALTRPVLVFKKTDVTKI